MANALPSVLRLGGSCASAFLIWQVLKRPPACYAERVADVPVRGVSLGQGQGSLNPSSPAQDSNPLGGSGPGNVDRRNHGEADDWGALPPKERQKALQQISKELPAHYREVIEEYFRKLARDGS